MALSSSRDLLIVGPAGHQTGGIAQYIAQQRRHVSDELSVSLYDVATPNGEGVLWLLKSTLLSLALVVRFPFRDEPDLVHVHTSHYRSFYLSSFYTLFAAYFWDCPVVIHTHGSSFDEFIMTDSWVVRRLQSWVFDEADAVVALSEYWRDVVERRAPPEKIVVLPNAVSVDEYTPVAEVSPPEVLFVSNHIRRKGLPEFVEAVRRISDETEIEFTATICGSGPLSQLAADLADDYEHVRYLGYVDEAKKRAVLDNGSIYVLPTFAEGLPIALLEGMAAGNAVISTDAGGIPDLVGPANGITVSPGDSEELTAALKQLLTSPAQVRKMAQANRELVSGGYSWDSTTDRLTELYAALLEADTDPTDAVSS